jgi:hypothetical protein
MPIRLMRVLDDRQRRLPKGFEKTLVTGKAGRGAGARSRDRLQIASSDAGTGSSAVLSSQLKEAFMGVMLYLLDLCNKAPVQVDTPDAADTSGG